VAASVLRLISEAGDRLEIEQDSVLIGRDASCDIQVGHASVSRRHALVTRQGDGWAIVDQASANGVLLDGRKISRGPLLDGQRLQLGLAVFRIEIEDGENTIAVSSASLRSAAAAAQAGGAAATRSTELLWWLLGGTAAITAIAALALVIFLWVSRRTETPHAQGAAAAAGALTGASSAATASAAPARADSARGAPAGVPAGGPGRASLLFVSPENCDLYVDGARVTRLSREVAHKYVVGPGEHLISARTGDGRRFERVVAARNGEQVVVQIELPAPARAADDRRRVQDERRER
jgi:hypothetical protein